MKGCKCIGIEIPKLAATQNHLEELGKTDSTAESYEDDSLEWVYLTSSQMQPVEPQLTRKSPTLWHFLSESTEEICYDL